MLAAALLAALASAAPAQPAASTLSMIGAAAAVHGQVSAQAPGAPVGRVIQSGKPLFLNDHVTTDAAGKLQVLLRDETVFTLGPNADMVLDEFVYDPSTDKGKVSARIAKGTFRFVTGKVARAQPENMKVKLSVGTIGIRGTVVVGETGPDGSLVINAGAGPNNDAEERPSAISLTNEGKTVYVTATGEGARVLPGQPPEPPRDLTADLDRISGSLEDRPSGRSQAAGVLENPAAQASGQAAAEGRVNASDDSAQAAESQSADQTVVEASQQGLGLAEGISQWQDLAQLQGQWKYIGGGTYSGGNGGGTYSFQMNVDFNARTLGGTSTGGPSSITLSGALSDTTQINTLAFGTSGPATVTLDPGLTNAVFNGTSASFLNKNGQAGGAMQINLKDSTGNSSGSGTGDKHFIPAG